MNIITDTEAAFISGIVDCEGCISIARKLHKNLKSYSYSIPVTVTNTNIELLEWLKSLTGLGIIVENKCYNNNYKIAYTWRLRISEIKEFLLRIKQYLVTKNSQLDLVLEFLELRKAHSSNPLTLDEKRIRKIIFEEIRDLNKRGRKV